MAADDERLRGLHSALLKLNKRAERGTGKTHALKYLAEFVLEKGHRAIYLDLRSIGSNSSIYSDGSRSLSDRASTLIIDVLNAVYTELYEIAVAVIDRAPDPVQLTNRLDDLASAISAVRVTGNVEREQEQTASLREGAEFGTKASLAAKPSLEAKIGLKQQSEIRSRERVKHSGAETLHLDFGSITSAMNGLLAVLNSPRLWLLIDEWSEIPIELQPYLADLLRRTILPINNITVKIASIEHRSEFMIMQERGQYVGLELGADVSADLNLDDFLVFDNDQQRAVEFFKNLIYKHYQSEESDGDISTGDELVALAFTQSAVFEEFVRAIEGVPRDALNLIGKAVTRSFGRKIAMNDIRGAARDWYHQDKASSIRGNSALNELLEYIIGEIIGQRRARAFLFPSAGRDPRVDQLFDARLLHILRKNVSTHDEPGVRYDVYKIDYGCYVELMNTTRMPQGLFQTDDESGYVEVPRDDYRSIRRAILRLEAVPADPEFT